MHYLSSSNVITGISSRAIVLTISTACTFHPLHLLPLTTYPLTDTPSPPPPPPPHTHYPCSLSLLAEILDGIKIHFDFMLADHLLFAQERSQYKQAVEERREQKHNVVKTVRNRTGQSETESRLQNNGTAVNSLPQQGSLENSTDPVGSKMEVDSRQVSRAPSPSDSQPPMPSGIYGAEHLLRLFVRLPLFLSRAQLPTAHIQTLHHCFKDLLELVIIMAVAMAVRFWWGQRKVT